MSSTSTSMSSISGAALGRSVPFRYAGNYLELFQTARVSDVRPRRRTFDYIPSNLTVQDTLEVLNERDYSSAPVQCVDSNKCLGFVDVLDIVAYLYKVLVSDLGEEAVLNLEFDSVKAHLFADRSIAEVVNFSKRNPFIPIASNLTLAQLLDAFRTQPELCGLHHLPIVDEIGSTIVDVISQSDLVSFVAKHHTTFDSLSELQVAKCKGTSPVVSIQLQACVLDAIAQMYDRGVTAISVVNSNNQLTAVLSLSDLRILNRARLNWIFLPIGVYLQRVYAVRNQVMSPLVVVQMHTRFETLLLKFASTRLHRLFVVDKARRPIGVITLTDLLLTVSKLPTTEDEYTELFLENMLVDHWDSESSESVPLGTPSLPLFAWSS